MKLTPRTMFRFVAPKQGSPMVHPYTWSAKIAHYNFTHQWQQNWFFRYTLYGMAAVFPVVYYIDTLVNSPAARAAYKKAKKAEEEKHHLEHKWADISGRNANR